MCWSPTVGCTAPSTYRASTRGPVRLETRYEDDIYIFGLAGPSVQLASYVMDPDPKPVPLDYVYPSSFLLSGFQDVKKS